MLRVPVRYLQNATEVVFSLRSSCTLFQSCSRRRFAVMYDIVQQSSQMAASRCIKMRREDDWHVMSQDASQHLGFSFLIKFRSSIICDVFEKLISYFVAPLHSTSGQENKLARTNKRICCINSKFYNIPRICSPDLYNYDQYI